MELSALIENIKRLSMEDFKELLMWLDEYEAQKWDEEFERDVRDGKLNKIAQQALNDFQMGKCRPL